MNEIRHLWICEIWDLHGDEDWSRGFLVADAV